MLSIPFRLIVKYCLHLSLYEIHSLSSIITTLYFFQMDYPAELFLA